MAVDLSKVGSEAVVKKLYEAMFLVDSDEAAADWDGVEGAIRNILKKAEAEIVLLEKWDERRLAYEIDGRSRGTYILCYFRAEGGRIRGIEREVKLSERIVRVLILCTEGRDRAYIERDIGTPDAEATVAEEDASGARVEEAPQEAVAEGVEETEAETGEGEDTESGVCEDEPLRKEGDIEAGGEVTAQ